MLWTGSIGRMRSEQHDYEKERIGGMTDRRIYQNMDDGTLMERYWLWLCSCPGLYRPQIAGLIAYFKDPKRLYEAQTRELMRWRVRRLSSKIWNREDCLAGSDGVFVAGDCRRKKIRQVTTAAADGAVAALAACSWLDRTVQ